jgi:hypothetical protein
MGCRRSEGVGAKRCRLSYGEHEEDAAWLLVAALSALSHAPYQQNVIPTSSSQSTMAQSSGTLSHVLQGQVGIKHERTHICAENCARRVIWWESDRLRIAKVSKAFFHVEKTAIGGALPRLPKVACRIASPSRVVAFVGFHTLEPLHERPFCGPHLLFERLRFQAQFLICVLVHSLWPVWERCQRAA